MSSVFDGYERQYCELSANITKGLEVLPSLTADESQRKLTELNASLEEADSLTRRMDLEARSLAPAQKASLLARIRELKGDLGALRRGVKAAATPTVGPGSSAADVVHMELLEGQGGRGSHVNGGDGGSVAGSKMLSGVQQAEDQTDRLQQSRRVLLETEDLGVSILEDLHQQRQTLLHARDNLYGVDDSIARARQILNSMARHMNRNKWITALVILILLAAIILVVALKLRSHQP